MARNLLAAQEEELDMREAHGKARREIDREVERELGRESTLSDREERAEVQSVAHELKRKSIAEVRESESDADRAKRIRRVYQFIDYVFYLIYGVVGLTIGLELLGARDGTPFMQFMRALTLPLLAPFKGVMPDPAVGSVQLMLSYVLALVVYMLLHKAVKGLFRLFVDREGTKI